MSEETNRDRRHPLRKFAPELLDPFLRGRKIVIAQLLSGGKSNSNYKIDLDDGSAWVVRLYSRTSPEFESHVMGLAGSLVPVPAQVYRGERWAVCSFLPGRPLADVPHFAAEAAKAIAQISTIAFDCPGRLNADGTVTPWPFQGIRGFVDAVSRDRRVSMWLGSARMERLPAALDRKSRQCAGLDAESRLVHGDFNPTNILIHEGKVSGVLDWEFAHAGSPYMDIGNLIRNLDGKYHDAVRCGLLEGGMDLPDDWHERAQLVDLTSQLEFLTSDRADSFKSECVRRIDRFLAGS